MKQSRKITAKPKIVTGSGRPKKVRQSFSTTHSKTIALIVVGVIGVLGTYLLVKSFAATPPTYEHSAAGVTIGSWNTYVDNKRTLDQAVPVLMQTADILGLQEVHTTAQRNIVKKQLICATCAYDGVIYKNKNSKKGIDPRGGYPIIWNRDKFERVSNLSVKKVADKLTGKIRFKARYAVWVTLRDKRTGKQLIVMNTHTYSRVEHYGEPLKNVAANAGYKKQMQTMVSILKSLQKKNIPIFVVGDLNVDYKHDDGQVAYFPYAMLTPLGFESNWKSANYLTAFPSASTAINEELLASTADEEVADTRQQQEIIGTYKAGSRGDRIIDYVYVWKRTDVAFQSTGIAGMSDMDGMGYIYGSDHAPIYATYTIGETEKAGP